MAIRLENTIVELEHRFWQAIVDDDAESAAALLAERSFVAGAQGFSLLSRDDYRRMAKEASGRYVLKSFKLENLKVTQPADNVAVIAYKATADMEVEGKPVTLVAADTTTWVRKGESWLVAAHTESLLGDPYSRDAKA